MIRHLSYVACDGCGQVAGGTDDLRENSIQARKRAQELGFRNDGTRRLGLDYCPSCWKERH